MLSPRGLELISSTQIGQLTAAYSCSYRGSDSLFWPAYKESHIHINKNKSFKKKGRKESRLLLERTQFSAQTWEFQSQKIQCLLLAFESTALKHVPLYTYTHK